MNLLFIESGTKYKKDENGSYYTDGNLNESVWNRYKNYCDNLTVMGRCENKVYNTSLAKEKFNFVKGNIKVIELPDIYSNKFEFLNFKKRAVIKKIIKKNIESADFVVIRSVTKFYNILAAKVCDKLNKKYVIEVTGSAFGSFWYRGDLYGKVLALPTEIMQKKAIKKAPNVIYVTNKALQNEYPNNNHNIGCSDVEVLINKNNIDDRRIKYINHFDKKNFTLGTIGQYDSKLKGQATVIKAISKLKKKGYNIRYELVGRGNNCNLLEIAKKYNVVDNVLFIGEMNHERVFEWFKNLDIYIQPSYTEGLCRSIVEAMSMGCPIIATNVGGNIELANNNMQFKKGNCNDLIRIIEQIEKDSYLEYVDFSYNESLKFEKNKLDKMRDDFYLDIIKK